MSWTCYQDHGTSHVVTTEKAVRARRGGAKLREWLEENGQTMAWLEGQTGIPQRLIQHYCQGRARPTFLKARIIELATSGEVAHQAFLTDEELQMEARLSVLARSGP